MAIQTISYHYSEQDGQNHFLVMKTQSKINYASQIIHANYKSENSITHTYINTIYYHYS